MIDTSGLSLKIQAKMLKDILDFEDNKFKRYTKAKFVGETMKDLLNNTEEKK